MVATIFSGFNLGRLHRSRRTLSLGLNIVVDVLLAFYLLAVSLEGVAAISLGQPGSCPDYPGIDPDDLVACHTFARAFAVVLGLLFGLGVVLG